MCVGGEVACVWCVVCGGCGCCELVKRQQVWFGLVVVCALVGVEGREGQQAGPGAWMLACQWRQIGLVPAHHPRQLPSHNYPLATSSC